VSKNESSVVGLCANLPSDSPGATFDDVMNWQSMLRESVDKLVVSELEPSFRKELASRFGPSFEQQSSACKWANSVLREAGVCLKSPTGFACSLVARRANPTDPGRTYLEIFRSQNSPDLRLRCPEDLNEIELLPLPQRSHNFLTTKRGR